MKKDIYCANCYIVQTIEFLGLTSKGYVEKVLATIIENGKCYECGSTNIKKRISIN